MVVVWTATLWVPANSIDSELPYEFSGGGRNDVFLPPRTSSIIFVDDSRGKTKSRRSRRRKLSSARKGILGSPHIMKKFAAIAVAASMFALAACGEKAADDAATTEAPAADATAEAGADADAAGAD